MAPFTPFLSEEIYQNLVRSNDQAAPVSVHMTSWPVVDPVWQNEALIETLSVVQKVVALGRTARERSRIRVRQPLSRLLVRLPNKNMVEKLDAHSGQVLDELNVKIIEVIEQDAQLVTYRVKPNLPRVGKRLGKYVPAVRAMLNDINGADVVKAQAAGDSITLDVEGQRLEFGPEDLLVETTAAPGFASAESEGFLVALDTELTPALETEGLAREMVRTVQEARKTTGLQISDRIALGIQGSPAIDAVLTDYRDYIMSETLATTWLENEAQDATNSVSHQLEQHRWVITIEKVS